MEVCANGVGAVTYHSRRPVVSWDSTCDVTHYSSSLHPSPGAGEDMLDYI